MIGWDYYVEGDGSEHDTGPDLDMVEAMVTTGAACGECLAEFTGPHGHRVVCQTCGRETMIAALAEQGYQLATRHEKNKLGHQERARQKRARKNV